MSDFRGVLFAVILALIAGVLAGYLIFGNGSCGRKSQSGKRVVIHTDTIVRDVRIKEQILIPQYSEQVKIIRDTVFTDNGAAIEEREVREYTAQADTILEENGCLFEISFISPVPLRKESFFRLSVNCPPVVTVRPEIDNVPEVNGENGGIGERISLGAFIGYGVSVTDKKVSYAPVAGIGIGIRILP